MEVTDSAGLDVAAIKADFPILSRRIHDRPLVFLDSAASSQKPRQVLEAMDHYYETTHANVHRAAYTMAEEATNAMEGARAKVARFIGAARPEEIVFTKNATESINLVARSWGATNLGAGDAVLLSQLEHHANIVPWQQLAADKGIEIRWIPLTHDGQLDLTDIDRLIDGVSLLSISAMSNVVGTVTPVRRLADIAHGAGALVSVDACQFTPHLPTDVTELGADFLAFSGHKMLGPTGIGVLWAHHELLEEMPPFLGGGGMILDVRLDGFIAAEVPHKFEAGTPPIAEIVGLGAAVDYLDAAFHLDEERLSAFAPGLDLATVDAAQTVVCDVCRGVTGRGRPTLASPGKRFGWLAAPRSTVVQPGPVHGGVTHDPAAQLHALADRLVRA